MASGDKDHGRKQNLAKTNGVSSRLCAAPRPPQKMPAELGLALVTVAKLAFAVVALAFAVVQRVELPGSIGHVKFTASKIRRGSETYKPR